MSKPDGGPAFPQSVTDWNNDRQDYVTESVGGMSLRDYFAAKALQGLLSGIESKYHATVTGDHYSRVSYKIADAMLAERNK